MVKVDIPANTLREQVSLMVDGELDGDECEALMQQLGQSGGEGSACWEQYHLIGDAMRNELPDTLFPHLADTVTAAIATEPSHQLEPLAPAPNVTQMPPATAAQARNPIVGYAIAASISAFAIAGLYHLNQAQFQPQPAAHQVVATSETQSEPGTISWSREANTEALPRHSPYTRTEIPAEKLHQYLINHNEFAIGTPPQGTMLPYARLVGYERPR